MKLKRRLTTDQELCEAALPNLAEVLKTANLLADTAFIVVLCGRYADEDLMVKLSQAHLAWLDLKLPRTYTLRPVKEAQ